jgi:glycosyltransferase involved in cell wall biosynthesis
MPSIAQDSAGPETRRLNVLFLVDHARGISGPHRNVVGSLNALSRRSDMQIRLLCSEIDRNEPYAQPGKVDIHLGFDPQKISRFAANVRDVVSAARDCDVIYVPTCLKALLYAQIARGKRRLVAGPNVTHLPIRSNDSPGFPELNFFCDLWIEASAHRRDHVVKCTGDESIRVVRHAIDTEKWGPHRANRDLWKERGLPADGLKLLLVSRDNEPRKGVGPLIEAFAIIRRKTSAPVYLVLAGEISAARKSRIREIGGIYELGFVGPDRLPELIATADISVIPSSWENFPFTVLESMASGTATVAARVGGIPEQMRDEESGLLVDTADEKSIHLSHASENLAAAILRLVDDAELRKRIGKGARERILSQFTEKRLGDDLARVLLDDFQL